MPHATPTRISSRSNTTKSRIRRKRSRRKRKSDSSQLHPLLQLQQTMGNQAVGRLIQAKLKVGQPGDKFEQEADRVAEQVVNMPESVGARSTPMTANAQGPSIQRVPEMEDDKRVLQGPYEAFENPLEEEEPAIRRMPQVEEDEEQTMRQMPMAEEDEEQTMRQMPMAQEDEELRKMPTAGKAEEEEEETVPNLQTKSNANTTPSVSPSVPRNINNMRGGGKTLPKPVRTYFEPRFGIDFSQVRVHTDARAASTAKAVNARAFTIGRDVVFGVGEYSPTTTSGRKLLAHELTHVLQQERRRQPEDGVKMMRQEDVPSTEDLNAEIIELKSRLADLRKREVREGVNLDETIQVEELLASKETLLREPIPVRRKIMFHRERLRKIRDDFIDAPSSELHERMMRHQKELAKALEDNIYRLNEEITDLYERMSVTLTSDPEVEKAIKVAETEIKQNETELNILKRIFSPEQATAFAEKYRTEVRPLPGGGCMTAFYKGVEALHTPEISKEIGKEVRTTARERGKQIAKRRKITDREKIKKIQQNQNSVDLILEIMQKNGMAGNKVTLKYDRRRKEWIPKLEDTVLNMIRPEFLGWYFFGLSVSGGVHSVILVVDNLTGGSPQIYWMDQYAKGFTKNVTGKVDQELKEWEPSYGYTDTRVWPLLPTSKAIVAVP